MLHKCSALKATTQVENQGGSGLLFMVSVAEKIRLRKNENVEVKQTPKIIKNMFFLLMFNSKINDHKGKLQTIILLIL